MTPSVPARLTLAIAIQLTVCPWARAEVTTPPAIRVALAPAMVDKMSGLAWRAMTDECSQIWAREGIALGWRAGGDDASPAAVVLPLVFDHREVRKHDPKGADAFGVTLFAGRSHRIVVSIPRARQVVARRHGFAGSEDSMTLDIATGRLLGRVVAHEIGHALLLTTTHSTRGLMIRQIDAHDLRPSAEGQFALTLPERDRLALRFSNTDTSRLRADATPAVGPAPGRTLAASGAAALADFTWTDAPPAPSRLRARR